MINIRISVLVENVKQEIKFKKKTKTNKKNNFEKVK